MKATIERPKLHVERILPHLCRHQQPGEGVHQAILDVGYEQWHNQTRWRDADMVNWMGEQFGEVAKLAVLIGKYNQQVTNGGHFQLFDNGYCGQMASGNDPACPLHREMMELLRISCLNQLPVAAKVYDILGRFQVEDNALVDCEECGGSGSCEEDCQECEGSGERDHEICGNCGGNGSEDETCGCCGGSGQVDSKSPGFPEGLLEQLDDAYYAVDERLMAELEDYFQKWVQTGNDPLAQLQPLEPKDPVAVETSQKPKLKLVGTDGNAFVVMGRATDAMRKAGLPEHHIDDYLRKAQSGDYDKVLATTIEFCDVS